MTNPLTASSVLLANPIETFIPHRAPMILIDNIVSHQVDSLVTQTHITTNSAYFDKQSQGVANYVGIEYMAQSIAALAGVEATMKSEPIKVGFLLGTRKLVMHHSHFQLGKTYQTHVARLYQEDSGLAVFDCQIYLDDTLIAQANVNVFQPSDTQAYINDANPNT
ncbi:hotdog family protein [Shewanella gaetbuli]